MYEFVTYDAVEKKLSRLMASNPQMEGYKIFEDIPESLRTTPCIRAWMAFRRHGFCVPEEYVNDSIVFQGLYQDPLGIRNVYKHKTSRYRHMLIFSAYCHHQSIAYMPVVFLTKPLIDILKRFRTNPLGNLIHIETVESIFDSALVNYMVSTCPSNLRLLNKYPERFAIEDASVVSGIRTSAFCYGYVQDAGKLHILEDMLREGYWPGEDPKLARESEQPGVHWGARPSCPREAVERMMIVRCCHPNARSGVLPIFKALFNTYDTQQIIDELATSQDGINYLFENYPTDKIRVFAQNNRRLRGALLEHDLGGFTAQEPLPQRRQWR